MGNVNHHVVQVFGGGFGEMGRTFWTGNGEFIYSIGCLDLYVLGTK